MLSKGDYLLLISIHAPRVGSDFPVFMMIFKERYFNPRSPCGERLAVCFEFFQAFLISIHAPRVGSDAGQLPGEGGKEISIHAPRVGSDFALNPMSPGSFISIHAPRVGSDLK